MGDPFKKVQRGDPLRISAETFNTMIEAARDYRARQHRTSSDAREHFTDHGVILVKNQSGAARNRFDILGLDAPVISPADNLDEFKSRPALVGVTPELPTHAGRFCILLEPLASGSIGRALVSGVGVARVNVIDPGHRFAEVVHEDPTRLRSAHAGSVEILWKDSGTGGDRWAVVRLGGGELVARFELLANLAPGGSALARLVDDSAATFTVHDALGVCRGRARSEGYHAGSIGYARFYHDLGRWEVIAMQPHALILGALVNEASGVERTTATFAVDGVVMLQPTGGLLDTVPTTARNVLKLRLLDNDPVLLVWNETDQTWDAIGQERGAVLRHGLVQSGWENAEADQRRAVSVKLCDKDGGNVTGDAFNVYTGLAPGKWTWLFPGDVVDFIEAEDGAPIIVSHHHDERKGTIQWLAIDPDDIKPGWALCDGENGTVDLRDRFIVCYRGGDGKEAKDCTGDEGDYANLGETGGHAWHGKSFNGHPDHPNHRHQLDASTYGMEDVQIGTGVTVINLLHVQGDPPVPPWTSGADKLSDGDDLNWSHGGPDGADDTDNRPPYYVLAAIQRVE